MFISLEKIQEIVRDAHEDVLDYLQDSLDIPVFMGELTAAHNEVAKHDKAFGEAINADFKDFIEPFLNWLETKQEHRALPWKTRDSDDVSQPLLPSESKCRTFLLSILDRLERMTEPSDELGSKISHFGNEPSAMLRLN